MIANQTATIESTIANLGLTMTAEFVPYSDIPRAVASPKLAECSLNWTVTIKRNGRDILTTPYSAGIGHCPSYKQTFQLTAHEVDVIRRECQSGRSAQFGNSPIIPRFADVLWCLLCDAEAIDHPTFETWANDFGYEIDSRKAEANYRACLEIGLKLRAGIGEDGLTKLQEAFQNY